MSLFIAVPSQKLVVGITSDKTESLRLGISFKEFVAHERSQKAPC